MQSSERPSKRTRLGGLQRPDCVQATRWSAPATPANAGLAGAARVLLAGRGGFRGLLAAAVVYSLVVSSPAGAQTLVSGFSVERLSPAPAGAAWLTQDDLNLRGKLGAAVTLTGGYARNPWVVSGGAQRLSVVSAQASADLGFAVLVDRYRFTLNLGSPLYTAGQSGTVGAYSYQAPSLDPGRNPDNLLDLRLGTDALLLGRIGGALRLGAGVQLFVPTGERSSYLTDGTYRALGRLLVAGDPGSFTFAGQLAAHYRPRDASPAVGGPHGSELLVGLAAGPRFYLPEGSKSSFVVGPELTGQTAFNALLGARTTGFEALLSGRFEQPGDRGSLLRFKLGGGAGVQPAFGTPEWRVVLAVEVLGRAR